MIANVWKREEEKNTAPENRTEIQEEFYSRKQWQECRNLYMKYRNHLCERCLKAGRVTPADIVHHKKYLTPENYRDPEISLNFDNLEALCKECHNREHFKKETPRRWKFVDGELITSEDEYNPLWSETETAFRRPAGYLQKTTQGVYRGWGMKLLIILWKIE